MPMIKYRYLASLWLSCAALTVQAETLQQCLSEYALKAPDTTLLADLKSFCREKLGINDSELQQTPVTASETVDAEDLVTYRLASEEQSEANPFKMTAYKPNYFLFATYNNNLNNELWESNFPNAHLDHVEAKFQLSFKARIAKGVLGGDLWGAYTQQSWWQLYNSDESAPFRETNYEPEIYLRWDTDFQLLGFNNSTLSLGFNHESNGRGELLSRSWNRIIAAADIEKGNLLMVARAWYRLPEKTEDDDNPDIEKYMGYGDLSFVYRMERHNLGMTLLNNLRSDNKGAVQLDWTFPLANRFRGYIQYYHGYGESLIDYNHRTNRIGVGILLNDWL